MSNTTPKRGRSDIYFHRKDAKHAEDLFFFCFPLSPAKKQRGASKGGKQKEATLRDFNLLL